MPAALLDDAHHELRAYRVTIYDEANGPPDDDPKHTVEVLAKNDDHALAIALGGIRQRHPERARRAWCWHIERRSPSTDDGW